MKTTIYELLGMIKDGKTPKKILFKDQEYEYDIGERDYYYCNGAIYWLFDSYVITNILNDEVEILETTITLKDSFNYLQKLADDEIPNKIEKIEPFEEDVKMFRFAVKYPEVADKLIEVVNKINEIIEVLDER